MNDTSGKLWSRAGFGFGILASLAANVEHVLIHAHAPIGAVLASAYWPVALLIAIEVLARVNWPGGRKWWLLRYGGLGTVAMVAAIISYSHMEALFIFYGEGSLTAHIAPIGVDGLMILCSTALLAISDNLRKKPVIGKVVEPVSRSVSHGVSWTS